MSTSLKETLKKRILEDVIRSCRDEKNYKVLVLDNLATKIVSSCCKMVDIFSENIMIIEDLHKSRQQLQKREAIYFLTPTDESISLLLKDFVNKSPDKVQYKAAHLFFTDKVPDELFQEITESAIARYVKTFKEVNIAFIASENRIFDLNQGDSLIQTYSTGNEGSIAANNSLERIADQLSTVCATLNEYPSVRWYRNSSNWSNMYQTDHCERLANLVQQKLNSFKADDPEIGESSEKHKSQLIILDRSFDTITPLLHELTYQAMVLDLVTNSGKSSTDIYTYNKRQNGQEQVVQIPLDEEDELWVKNRHKHIAEVLNNLQKGISEFSKNKKMSTSNGKTPGINELKDIVRKMPQYQKECAAFGCHQMLAQDSMDKYNNGIEELVKVEQDLATGTDTSYNRIREPMRGMIPILTNENSDVKDKVRLILLFILFKGGISPDALNTLFFGWGLFLASGICRKKLWPKGFSQL